MGQDEIAEVALIEVSRWQREAMEMSHVKGCVLGGTWGRSIDGVVGASNGPQPGDGEVPGDDEPGHLRAHAEVTR